MKHLALSVGDQERSRSFYETYLGFGAQPPRRYDDDVLMLYDDQGFALALGPFGTPSELPRFLHFGKSLGDPASVKQLAERLRTDGVEIVEEWDEPSYVSVKCRDPDGYVVEISWEE